jgi:hypothetical protein
MNQLGKILESEAAIASVWIWPEHCTCSFFMPSARRSAQAKGCGLPSSAASWTQARVCRSEKSSTACGGQRIGRG